MRQGQAVEPKHDAEHRAEPERICHPGELRRLSCLGRRVRRRMVMQQPLADRDAHDDPADGPPHPHEAEVSIAIRQVGEGDRVRQRQRRRVDERVQQTERHEPRVALDGRESPDKHAAKQVTDREELLRRKVPVRNLPGQPRSHDRPDRSHHEHVADLFTRETAMIRKERPEQGQPGAPDGVLQEHHGRQPKTQVFHRVC